MILYSFITRSLFNYPLFTSPLHTFTQSAPTDSSHGAASTIRLSLSSPFPWINFRICCIHVVPDFGNVTTKTSPSRSGISRSSSTISCVVNGGTTSPQWSLFSRYGSTVESICIARTEYCWLTIDKI